MPGKLVPEVRIELTTYPLPRGCATTTLLRRPEIPGSLKLTRPIRERVEETSFGAPQGAPGGGAARKSPPQKGVRWPFAEPPCACAQRACAAHGKGATRFAG